MGLSTSSRIAIPVTILVVALAFIALSGTSRAQDNTDRPAKPSRTFRAIGLDETFKPTPRTGATKDLTTSGRVRRSRLVVWLFEGSEGMNERVFLPSGLTQFKGVTAMHHVSKTLKARSQGLSMVFEVWRGSDATGDPPVKPLGHRGQFDAASEEDMAALVAWVESPEWGATEAALSQKWAGTPDLIPSLKRAFAAKPDSIIVVAGSMPIRPPVSECPADAELGGWVVSKLKEWAGDETLPPVHILGIGLDSVSGAFYERIASATLGTVTEVGSSLDD
jgi:hypothetical protein